MFGKKKAAAAERDRARTLHERLEIEATEDEVLAESAGDWEVAHMASETRHAHAEAQRRLQGR